MLGNHDPLLRSQAYTDEFLWNGKEAVFSREWILRVNNYYLLY